jgi:hypothetical protein
MAFLTPSAFPVLGCVLLAAAALALVTRRQAARARRLGFRASRVPPVSGLVAIAAMLLVALAAAQPAMLRAATERSRDDVQVWIAVDTSNSMLAAQAPGAVDRLQQAQQAALALRGQLGGLKVGLAEMTARVLPLLPPTADQDTFAAVDMRSVQADTPRPRPFELVSGNVSTSFANLTLVPDLNFYGTAKRKLLVVISDMESGPFTPRLVTTAFASHHVGLVLVRVGSARDRVWANGHLDPSYRPQRSQAGKIVLLAEASAGGRLFTTGDTGAVAQRVRALAGHGPSSAGAVKQRDYVLLSPYLLLATLPLLVYLLAAATAGLVRPTDQSRRWPRRSASSLRRSSFVGRAPRSAPGCRASRRSAAARSRASTDSGVSR